MCVCVCLSSDAILFSVVERPGNHVFTDDTPSPILNSYGRNLLIGISFSFLAVVKCQKTWRYLRERFARESRLQAERKQGLKREKWEIFDSLVYLLPHIKRRRYDKRSIR